MNFRFWNKYKIVEIEGQSMKPYFKSGWYVLFKKHKVSELNRGDIVLHQYQNKKFTKRIIGLPNEHIEIRDHKLFINDSIVEENYLDIPRSSEYISQWQSSDNEYVLLGDNSLDSLDSRKLGLLTLTKDVYTYKRIIWPFRRK
ncbi:MAG: signal peptidase I [Candidatus Kariarchaeaceae archaeon]|jgi:signal peptidase I